MIKALIGNGGDAREVMSQMSLRLFRFVDDEYWTEGDDKLLPLSKFDPKRYSIMIAIGDSTERFEMSKRLPLDTEYFTFIHPTSIVDSSTEIGKGSFIGAYSIITTDNKLGEHTLLNRSNHVGHDCKIGNFLSMMPGSIISGNVNIGNRFYIGTNSSVREKINICDDVMVGLSSGVVKDLVEPGVYVGSPVKKIK